MLNFCKMWDGTVMLYLLIFTENASKIVIEKHRRNIAYSLA